MTCILVYKPKYLLKVTHFTRKLENNLENLGRKIYVFRRMTDTVTKGTNTKEIL